MMQPKPTRGRPSHIPSVTDRRLVLMLASGGIPQAEISRVLDISEKTLRKAYRKQLDIGAARLQAALAGHLLRLAAGTDDVALRAIIFILRCRFGWSRYLPPR
ncbi:RNA polymerase subunit sigma-70 [Rhizobium leguminosarum bv. viciae]|nr:RNA polymerase subunit sigma-70 [Rhizobium leguminosarum]TCB30464.1 RNA polymerase subunit sigma-70 [Rhizobium leguminosarum bv. viciae]